MNNDISHTTVHISFLHKYQFFEMLNLPEVVGIPTCILYNKPYSKNACIGYWPTDENETVGAMTFICSGVNEMWHFQFVTTRL